MVRKSGGLPVKDWPQIRMLRALALASETFREAHKVALRTFRLSLSEFDLIASLGNTEGMRMKEIAEHMMTSSSASNVTRICIALEERGLVERKRSPHSDREVLARLTREGQELFERTFPKVSTFSRAFVDSGLSVDDQKHVADLLRRFSANVRIPQTSDEPGKSKTRDAGD